MTDVAARDLVLGDVVCDPHTDRDPGPDGFSYRVRIAAWTRPDMPGEVAFQYEILETGGYDWASYDPDAILIRDESAT